MRQLRSPTDKPIVLDPVWPNAGVQAWYEQQLDRLVDESAARLTNELTAAWIKTPPIFKGSHITGAYGDAMPEAFRDVEAAGVVFRVGELVLLMKRTDGQGWAFPGGSVELNETSEGAARREAFEETLHAYNGPLEYYHTQEFKRVRFATFVADVLETFTPTLNKEHSACRWVTPTAGLRLKLHPGVRRTMHSLRDEPQTVFDRYVRREPGRMVYADDDYDEHGQTKYGRGKWQEPTYEVAYDAPSPTKALQIALARWGTQTIKRFDLMAQKIADDFATRNQHATQTSMLATLKKAGFTVKFKPTRESVEAFRVVAAENVGLIKSIPRKYHTDVEQKVWDAVRGGGDLHKLSEGLRKAHKVTTNRAALIARDQNAKAKAVMERVRQMELGFKRGFWMHSSAGKEPRRLHVKWGRENKQYALAQGMWDSDEGEYVHPGQLINCRCTMRVVIESFG